MLRKIEKNAKNVEEAVALAAEELGVSVDEVSYEVEREVGKGLMGLLLGREVIISAWVTKEAEEEERKAASAKAKEKVRAKAQEVKAAKEPNPYAPKQAPVAKDHAPKPKKEVKETVEKPAPQKQSAPKPAPQKPDTSKWNREVTEKSVADATYFSNEIIKKMGFDDATVTVENTGEAISVNVAGSRMGLLIGKRGDTLDAVQYLTSLYVNKEKNSHIKVNVDTENYRSKREETLIKLAHGLEKRVLRDKKAVTLEPMSPNERRIIHAALQNNDKIKTYSVGEEPNRKIVVAPNK